MTKKINVILGREDQIFFLEEIKILEKRIKKDLDNSFDKKSSITAKGGRPYKNSPKELAEKGIEYFRRNIKRKRPITISGLVLNLDTSRRQLINLQNGRPDRKGCFNESFGRVVFMLKNFVGLYYETTGELAKNPYFHIFVLRKLWGINNKKPGR